MSTVLWVFFWIGFALLYKLMFIRLPPIPFYIGLFIASYIQTSYIPHIEIPNAVFWVLFSFLLLSVRPQSIGLGCFWLLIFTHWPFPAIHMNPTVLAVGFWLSFTLILSLVSWLLFRTLSITAFVCFIASAIVMRDRITYPMSWTWVALWGFLLGALEQTLPPEMPIGWHCFWTPVIFLLGLGIRPDKSTIRFFLWVIAFYVPRSIIAYFFFLLYFRSAERDRLFPFNLFRLKWRRSQPVWCPLSLNPEPRDSATADFVLCKTCDRVVGQSKLIMGSSKYLTRLEEWHDHETLQDLKHFISVKTSCRLCHLFWYSISKSRRDSLGMGLCSTTSSSALSSAVSSQSTEFNTSVLRVKIWEERPLSLYTFAGLFLDNKPLGARILIHREEVFQKPSISCQLSWTGSSEHFEQAKKWLHNCREHHNLCNMARKAERELPTRLLYVGSVDPKAPDDDPIVRLELTEGKDPKTEYLAFSHCWGGDIPFKLVEKNLCRYKMGVPVSKLPKNMRDAFWITQSLGFSYLWIDSLCIIQRDNENIQQSSEDIQRSSEDDQGSRENIQRSNKNDQTFYENKPKSDENIQDSNENMQQSSEDIQRSNEDVQESSENIQRCNENNQRFYDNNQKSDENIHDSNEIIQRSSEDVQGSNEDAQESSKNIQRSNENIQRFNKKNQKSSENIQEPSEDIQGSSDDIQGWREDWEKEAARMGAVYSNAVCTIASTGSTSSAGGCFHDRSTLSLPPCKIGASSLDTSLSKWIYARRDDVFDFQRNVDRSPLNKRAWVQQERLFSRRILHFGTEMIYWECCRRSASELAPNGYVYKRYPDDFSDNYFPDLGTGINTRADLEAAEQAGRGLLWGAAEAVRLRPPPVDLDPDDPTSQMLNPRQTTWQRKRGFWKEARKPSDESWEDKSIDTELSGFKAAFEKLRKGEVPKDQVGQTSFSNIWYEVVESYTRCALSIPSDKLIALRSLVEEIQGVTGYTYLSGLWKEHLLTDLLWFAVEGPGHRLNDTPTWSWASINGTVALDLLPENSFRDITIKATLTIMMDPLDPTSASEGSSEQNNPAKSLELNGPILNVSVARHEENWVLDPNTGGAGAVKFFPDVSEEISDMSELFCLSVLVLEREKDGRWMYRSEEVIQGLVLESQDSSTDTYKRVGFFTTSRMKNSRSTRKRLMRAPVKHIRLE